MKQRNKRQLLAAMAAMAALEAAGGVSYAADPPLPDSTVILTPKDKIETTLKNSIETPEDNPATGQYFYGVIGGNNYLDENTISAIGDIKTILHYATMLPGVSDKIPEGAIDAVASVEGLVSDKFGTGLSGTANPDNKAGLALGDYGIDWVRYYGASGGDLVVNTNLHQVIISDGKVEDTTEPTTINVVRDEGYTNDYTAGTVILGSGSNIAAGIGNVYVSAAGILNYGTSGNANYMVNGKIETSVHDNANVIGYANGGLALGLGGGATSTVHGDTVLEIDGTNRDIVPYDKDKPIAEQDGFEDKNNDSIPQLTTAINVMKGSGVSAIGVSGGGTAVSTIGGNATSTVDGTTNINVTNATVIGAVGGGVSAAVDATGIAETLKYPTKQLGNDDGTTDFGIAFDETGNIKLAPSDDGEDAAPIKVIIEQANEGGTATTQTKETFIKITGDSTAAGILGGGAAVAAHTYTYKEDGTDKEYEGDPTNNEYSVNDEFGRSEANAYTGKATINIDLSRKLAKGEKESFISSVLNLKNGIGDGKDMAPDILKGFTGKGAVVGVFGGGAAVAQSGNRQHLSKDENGNADQPLSETDGAFATAVTDGADISLVNGYVAGIMGGGVAGAINNSTATSAMTGTVNIQIGTEDTNPEIGAEAVGVFGNGLAYFTGTTGVTEEDVFANLKGTATASAVDSNITVFGDNTSVDGIIGGGMAIDDSDAARTNAIAETSGKVTINVVGGTINKAAALGGLAAMNDLGDLAAYADGVNKAAGNAAIAAGGIALGGGAKAYVNEAEVNIAGGTVAGDIYGGGIAAYGYANNVDGDSRTDGSHVGTSTINLYGAATTGEDGETNTTIIDGNVYAGGAVSTVDNRTNHQTDRYESANATVDNATVNLAGAQVNGILYGTGTVDKAASTDASVAVDSTLNLIGENTLSTKIKVGEKAETKATKIQDYTNVVAKAGSETILDGSLTTNDPALISGGTFTAEDGAYLNIENLKTGLTDGNMEGNTYKVIADAEKDSAFWNDADLVYDRMSGVYAKTEIVDSGDSKDKSGLNVKYEAVTEENADEAADSMSDALDAGSASNLIQQGMRDGWHNISGGADEYFDDWQNHEDSNAAFRRGMMIGEDAAVTGNTVSIARDMADNVMQRLSFTDDYVQDNGWVNNDGGIWAKYIHRKYETDNMGSSVGGIHSSTDYDGAIVGVDFAKHGNFQSGVAFHYGSGDGNGLISRNDYDAWGFTLYGSLKDEEAGTNLMADIGYVTSDNDSDGTVAGKSLSADRDVDAWTIGLRGEKEYTFGQNQLVPYVGLRYMSVNPARYTAYYNGKAAFDYDADNQNLWLLPIGVSFRNETVTDGGWRITPKLDLSYIWAFGDTDTDMTVNAGTYSTALYYDVMDDNSWLASLGVEATKDVWSFGVGYGYQKGDDTKNKTWFVNASYAF